jgi:hypothetical protein
MSHTQPNTKGDTMDYATERLIEMGATHETKEDHFGDTKNGWWMDTVWLAPYSNPREALQAVEG